MYDYRLPLTSDSYFFGRDDILFDFINGIRNSENRGLFGLRKTGKTSFLFKLQRLINSTGLGASFYYDCKYPSIRNISWEKLLLKIANDIVAHYKLKVTRYNSSIDIADYFLEVLSSCPSKALIVIIFDEIEFISPFSNLDLHWKKEFIPFWQTIWSCQSRLKHLSIIISGVNPSVVEYDLFDKVQNPLFAIVPAIYLKGLKSDELHRMVTKIGRPMGLRYETSAVTYIYNRYGGHPLLTRIACHLTNETIKNRNYDRPYTITEIFLKEQEDIRDSELHFYCRHVMSELKEFYKDEYEMLELLSSGQLPEYIELSKAPEFITHLIKYGLVERNTTGKPRIAISVVGRYVALELARKEGRRTLQKIIDKNKRDEWLQKRIKAIGSDITVLENVIERMGKPSLYGINSYPESDKFYSIKVCEDENDFSNFINTCNRCFVESIEAFGKSINKNQYIWKEIKDEYTSYWENIYRIKLYRHHRAHIKLKPKINEDLYKYLTSDLEGRNPSQVPELWFTLQQCVLDGLLMGILIEIDNNEQLHKT